MDKNCCEKKCQYMQWVMMEERVKSLECTLQQVTLNLRNKDNLLRIQTEQLQKMETMYKRLVVENENLNCKNRKHINDIENLKIILKGYEETTSNPYRCETANITTQTEFYEETSINQGVLSPEDLKTAKVILTCFNSAVRTLNPGRTTNQLEDNHEYFKNPPTHEQCECLAKNDILESNVGGNYLEHIRLLEQENEDLRRNIEKLKSNLNVVETKSVSTSMVGQLLKSKSADVSENNSIGTNTVKQRSVEKSIFSGSKGSNPVMEGNIERLNSRNTMDSTPVMKGNIEQLKPMNIIRPNPVMSGNVKPMSTVGSNSVLSGNVERVKTMSTVGSNSVISGNVERVKTMSTVGSNSVISGNVERLKTMSTLGSNSLTSERSKSTSTNMVETNSEYKNNEENEPCKCHENEYQLLMKEIEDLRKEVALMRNSKAEPGVFPKVEEEVKSLRKQEIEYKEKLECYQYEMLKDLTDIILLIYKERDELRNIYMLFETKFNDSLKTLDAGTNLLQNKVEELSDLQTNIQSINLKVVNMEGIKLNKMQKKFLYLKQQLNDNQQIINEYLNFKQFWAVQIQEIAYNTNVKINSDKLIEPEGIVKLFKQMVHELYTILQDNKSQKHLKELKPLNENNQNQTFSELHDPDLILNINSFNKTILETNLELHEKYKSLSELSQSKTQIIESLQCQIREKEEEVQILSIKLEETDIKLNNNVAIFRSTLTSLKDQSVKLKAAFEDSEVNLLNLKIECQEHTVEIQNLKEAFKIMHFLKQKNDELLQQTRNQREFLMQQKYIFGQILEDNSWLQCQYEQKLWDLEKKASCYQQMKLQVGSVDSEFKSVLDENEFLKQNFTYCHECLSLNQIMGNNLDWRVKVEKLTEFIARREMEVKVCVEQRLRASELLEDIAAQNNDVGVIRENSLKLWNQVNTMMNCLDDGEE